MKLLDLINKNFKKGDLDPILDKSKKVKFKDIKDCGSFTKFDYFSSQKVFYKYTEDNKDYYITKYYNDIQIYFDDLYILISSGISWQNKKRVWHREDGPALESFDGDRSWYKEGNLHREDGPAVEYADGSKYWFKNGNRHREDGPAEEFSDGTKVWFKNGKLHRLDGPARECTDGYKQWAIEGIYYTEDEFNKKIKNSKIETFNAFTNTKEFDFLTKNAVAFPIGSLKLLDILKTNNSIIFKFDKCTFYLNSEYIIHRDDGPAVEFNNGRKEWYSLGVPHRDDGPAVESENGGKCWYCYGLLHRDNDLPAVEESDGHKEWYKDGKLYKIKNVNNKTIYIENDKIHRMDGPAIEDDSMKAWVVDGVLHREDGPAIEYANGDKIWFEKGKMIKSSTEITEEKSILPIFGMIGAAALLGKAVQGLAPVKENIKIEEKVLNYK